MPKQKKRKRGMGSIYKHGRSWYIAYYVNGQQIKEKIGSVNLLTKGQVEQALKARMGEIVQGRFELEKTKKVVLFDNLIERYLEYSKANHRSYKRSLTISRVLLRSFSSKKLTDITSWSVEQFKVQRKNEGKALSTINRELIVLKRMFNLAIEWGLTGSNPVRGVKFFRVNNEPMRILTEEEFSKLYDYSADHLRPILLCAISTGMRKSEILNLKWQDVDFHSDAITVRDSKNFDFRVIPINETLKSVLNELHDMPSNDFVFNYKGQPVKEVKRSFETALKKSGITKYRFHDLRHTFATRLVMNGVDLVTVQELLGHKSIIMTKRYSHPTPEHKKKAVELVSFVSKIDNKNTIAILKE